MTSTTTGLTSGDFHLLNILYNGSMQDITTLFGGGGGGAVSSATLPLSIANGVISVNLAGYIPTTHEANKIGAADLVHGQYDLETKTVTLKNGSGVTAVLSVDNAGYLNVGPNGVITVNLLNAWDFSTIKIADSMNVSRNLTASITGQLVWNQSSLVDLNYLTTQLQAKQDILTTGAGIFLSNAVLSLTGTESRSTLKLADTNSTVRDLTSDVLGNLQWDGSILATQNWAHPLMSSASQSLGTTILASTHMPNRSVGSHGTWVDHGTFATVTLGSQSNGQDHYQGGWSCPANTTISYSFDVKLGTATNCCAIWWVQMSTLQEFSATNGGLNTSNYVTCVCTYTNSTASPVTVEWSLGRVYDITIPGGQHYKQPGTYI